MRHYKRAETVDGKVDTRALEEVGLSEARAGNVSLPAIANYEDRFVVPSSHRELARDAFPEKAVVALPSAMVATGLIPNSICSTAAASTLLM